LGFKQEKFTTIHCNNTEAIAIMKNLIFYKRTKHIDLRYHWVREKVQVGRFDTEFCTTAEQTANMLTKALSHPKHEKYTSEMGVSTV